MKNSTRIVLVPLAAVVVLASTWMFLGRHRAFAQVTTPPTGPTVANDKDYTTSPANPTTFYTTTTPSGPGTATQIDAAPNSATLITSFSLFATGATKGQAQTFDLIDVGTNEVLDQFTGLTDKNGDMNQVVTIPKLLIVNTPVTIQLSVAAPSGAIPTTESITVATLSSLNITQQINQMIGHIATVHTTHGLDLTGTVYVLNREGKSLLQLASSINPGTGGIPFDDIQSITLKN